MTGRDAVCLSASLPHLSSCLSTGLAYVGTMCDRDGSSVSVVEDDGTSVSEATATHELGHR